MDVNNQRERLNAVIRERAVRYGDFVLRSGAHSSFYLDCRQVTLDSEGAFLVASLMLARMEDVEAQAVGGPALGAVPIVGAVCALAHARGRRLSGFFIRKEAKDHGMGNLVEGALEPGMRVVMVEDTVTTGGELLRAVDAVREFGLRDCPRPLDRGSRRRGPPVHTRSRHTRRGPVFPGRSWRRARVARWPRVAVPCMWRVLDRTVMRIGAAERERIQIIE